MIDLLGGRLLSNASFWEHGRRSGLSCGDSQERVEALGGDGLAPDAIVVFMGINDYGWGGAKAQAAAGARAVPAQSRREEAERRVAGRAEEGAIEGFAKAYSSMLLRIRERYPEADIWCCTLCPGRVAGKSVPTFAWKLRGVPLESYNDAIRSAAASTDAPWSISPHTALITMR
ncbi:MAG: GDSL-type esterase/lipase family protein [Eggerthellaceae bacterium]